MISHSFEKPHQNVIYFSNFAISNLFFNIFISSVFNLFQDFSEPLTKWIEISKVFVFVGIICNISIFAKSKTSLLR